MRIIIYILILVNILCAQNNIYKRDLSRDVKEMFSDSAEAVVDTLTSSAKDTVNAFIEDSLDSSGIIDWDQLNDSAKDSIRQIISDSLSAHDALRLLNDSLYYFDYPKSVDDNPIYYWWSSSDGYIYILVDSLGNGVDGDPEAIGMIKVDSLGDGSMHELVTNTKSLELDSLTNYNLASIPIRTTAQDWTIEVWFYMMNISGVLAYLFEGNNAYKPRAYFQTTTFAGPVFSRDTGPVASVFGDSSVSLNFNRWVHVAVVHDASDSLKIYQGGVGVPDTLAGFHAAGGFNLSIKGICGNGWAVNTLKGYIDDLRIWYKARTLAEVNADKDQELDGDETNLAYYWKFNDSLTCDRTDSTNTLTKLGSGSTAYSTEKPF